MPNIAKGALLGASALYPDHLCIHELFETNALIIPDAPAIRFEGISLNYCELNGRANQLATLLRELGVKSGDLVGIALRRCPDMVIALLGILKAGAAYLPLDPDYPANRTKFMISNASAKVIVSTRDFVESIGATGANTVCLDDPFVLRDLQNKSTANINKEVIGLSPQNRAYVLYTSGSTGLPKGVEIHHRGVVNYLCHVRDNYFSGTGIDAVTSLTLNFDATVTSLLGPLVSGTCAELLPQDKREIERLARVMFESDQPKLFKLTPAHLTAALALSPVPLSSAKHVFVVGGEQFSGQLVRDCILRLPASIFVNEYGPTETVVGCSTFSVSSHTAGLDEYQQVPIGRPIQNTRLYVLSNSYTPCMNGSPGELFIGGDGVAIGYLNDPTITNKKFLVMDMGFGPERLYRTGDEVVRDNEGNLVFLGRLDNQVKLNGYRIELGEVEAALLSCENVVHAAAKIDGTGAFTKRLVAYVTSKSGSHLRPALLKDQLGKSLPSYMIPSSIVVIETMPLTLSGKIDRAALPTSNFSHISRQTKLNDEQNRFLSVVNSAILPCKVGFDSKFFESGGTSLSALAVVARLNVEFGVDIGLGDFYRASNIGEIYDFIKHAIPADSEVRKDYPSVRGDVSFEQRRMWMLDNFEEERSKYNVPLMFEIVGALDEGALQRAVQDIVRRHETLRTFFVSHTGSVQALVSSEIDLSSILEISHCSLNESHARLKSRLRHEFDLSRSYPIRVWLDVAEKMSRLLIVIHHIACDGLSLNILCQDISTAYEAALDNATPKWEQLPVKYSDYVSWQQYNIARCTAGNSVEQAQLSYWLNTLKGVSEEPYLPCDFPRPKRASHKGAIVRFEIERELHRHLVELSRHHDVSRFMTLQAFFAALLSQWGCGNDILIGTPASRRPDYRFDALVGLFLNTILLRIDTAGRPSFEELLGRVRTANISAYSNQDIPFERVVAALRPKRSLGWHPLFQVMIVYQSSPTPTLCFPGCSSKALDTPVSNTKFDLTLTLHEQQDLNGDASGIACGFEYCTDLFSERTIETLAKKLVALVRSYCANPRQLIDQSDAFVSATKPVPPKSTFMGKVARPLIDNAKRHPTTALEKTVVDIWQRNLGLECIDLGTSFFDYGGTSMSAMRVVAQIAQIFGAPLPVTCLFDHQTVVDLIGFIGDHFNIDVNMTGEALSDFSTKIELRI